MTEEEVLKKRNHLKDVDIEISLRSGGTDITDLRRILNAVKANLETIVDCDIVTTEVEEKFSNTSQRRLRSVRMTFYIQ